MATIGTKHTLLLARRTGGSASWTSTELESVFFVLREERVDGILAVFITKYARKKWTEDLTRVSTGITEHNNDGSN